MSENINQKSESQESEDKKLQLITAKEIADRKAKSFNEFFEKHKARFEMVKRNYPKSFTDEHIRYPIFYDTKKEQWHWLSRSQRRARK